MILRISKEGKNFLVDEPNVPGSPPVGRGKSIMEAIGRFVHNHQDVMDIEFEVHESAWKDEKGRRKFELSQR